LYADGVLALLGEAGIVDDEDPLGTGQGLSHHPAIALPNELLVPGALVDELLQGLFGVFDVEQFRRPGDAGGHRFNALAFPILEQTPEVDAAPGGLRGVSEQVLERFGILAKPSEDFRGEFWRVCLVHTNHTNRTPKLFVELNGVVLGAVPK
jgi:hypothetical protein